MARYYSHRSNLKQVAWLYIRLAPPYIRASRDLRRLESISLSPAFAGFDELLRGLAHIRAFGMEKRYQNSFYAKVDKFQSFDHCYWLVNCWLRWRYDCLGSVIVLLSTLFALWMKVRDGSTAIVIVQAGVFAEASRQLVRVAAQLELDFNSVERVIEYLDIPQEAPAIIEDHRPPAFWPSNSGKLVVENLSVKYAPALPAVLRNLSFSIEPSEKIGVVGRTGSGKSTLAMSLLRIIEPVGGRIIIDGIDISTIGLEDLRKRITIVSQDVSLFSGTLRSNLDPMEEHSPEECTEVMKRCHLDSVIVHKENDRNALLNMPVNQGSLSGGERQLVALSRAILRGTNVIIMDEATSQIDAQLDENIQKTIREELGGAIVITIAHRLKTIIDYDRILVLDDGEIAEFGTPKELLNKDGGVFKEMKTESDSDFSGEDDETHSVIGTLPPLPITFSTSLATTTNVLTSSILYLSTETRNGK
ncbi:pleiotropic drug resistance ABC transporter [Lentinula edodes]|nr:pleiotropic drug resistance ABC transporter [Lentinula edodes]